MKRITAIGIAAACCLASYFAGTAHPSPDQVAKITAVAYDAGRQSVIDDLPKPQDMNAACIAWWNGTNIKDAKKRFCTKGS